MRYERLKSAVLASNLMHSDVALRALDRIEQDEEFRNALEAVVATDNLEEVRRVIYEHFEPGDPVSRTPVPMQYEMTIDAHEIAKLVNDQALEVCRDLLGTQRIRRVVERYIGQHFESMVGAVLGLKKSAFDRWEFDANSDLARQFKALVHEQVESVFMEHFEKTDFADLARRIFDDGFDDRVNGVTAGQCRDIYVHEVRSILRDEAGKRARRIARIDAFKILEEHFGKDERARGIKKDDD